MNALVVPVQPRAPSRAAVPIAAMAVLAAMVWRLPGDYSFGAYAFAGAALIFLASARGAREIVSAALAAPALAVLVHVARSPSSRSALVSIATGVGAAAVITAAAAAAASRGNARELAIRRLAAVITMPALVVIAGIFLQESAGWHVLTFDGVLASVDRSFGVDPSAAAGVLVRRSAALWWTCKLVYDSLPMALCAVAAARWRRFGPNDRDHVLIAIVVACIAGQFVSQLVPASGPRFLWGAAFPMSAGSLSPAGDLSNISPAEFRNAFPSLHMTGALLVAWSARPFGRAVRLLACLYVAVTVVATLGSGEHYLVDLIVAAPFALAIRLGVRREAVKRVGLLLALVLAWTLLILSDAAILIRVPAIPVSLSIVSILVTLVPIEAARRKRLVPPLTPVFGDAAVNE